MTRWFMSILVRFSPPSLTAEQCDAILARLYQEGIHPILSEMGGNPGEPEITEIHHVIRRGA